MKNTRTQMIYTVSALIGAFLGVAAGGSVFSAVFISSLILGALIGYMHPFNPYRVWLAALVPFYFAMTIVTWFAEEQSHNAFIALTPFVGLIVAPILLSPYLLSLWVAGARTRREKRQRKLS